MLHIHLIDPALLSLPSSTEAMVTEIYAQREKKYDWGMMGRKEGGKRASMREGKGKNNPSIDRGEIVACQSRRLRFRLISLESFADYMEALSFSISIPGHQAPPPPVVSSLSSPFPTACSQA